MEKVATKALIDKSLFNKTIPVLACKIPVKMIGEFQKKFKNYLLQIPWVKVVKNIEGENDKKEILLSKDFGTEPEKLPENLREYVTEKGLPVDKHEVNISYDNYSTHEALEKVLPEGIVVPTGFETVGHIAHMNLGEEHMPYKYQIGQVFLEKNPTIKTVLTKVGHIENVYRTYNFEVSLI